jgi:N-acetylglucosaminyldiphosphoundecaprenol N-acetyl-beta-D-mannosaminyltransferase
VLRRVNFLGYPLIACSARTVASELLAARPTGQLQSVVFLNPHTVVTAKSDPELQTALESAHIVFCDGAGLSLAARLRASQRVPRIYGYEFFVTMSRLLSDRREGRVLFLGGRDELNSVLIARYRAEYPGIESVTAHGLPFKATFSDDDVAQMAETVTSVGADVVWLGLGSPKQEKVLARLSPLCKVHCAAAIGAVFDYYAGAISHPPAWVRAAGFQWAYRLALEPRRLWRRTFVSGPRFAIVVLRDWARRSK